MRGVGQEESADESSEWSGEESEGLATEEEATTVGGGGGVGKRDADSNVKWDAGQRQGRATWGSDSWRG